MATNKIVTKDIVRLHAEGKINKDIANILGVSPAAISYHLVKLKLASHGNSSPLSHEERKEALLLHEQGLNCHEIGRRINCSHQSVRRILASNGLQSNQRKGTPLKLVGEGRAECSECGGKKELGKFSFHKRPEGKSYRESFCNNCRRKKQVTRQNSDVLRFVSAAYSAIKARCHRRNVVFQLRKERVLDMFVRQKGLCFYTDIPMRCLAGSGASRYSLSIDRVIPERGYVDTNVVLCIKLANSVKTDLTLKELHQWLPKWYNRLVKAGFAERA